MQSPRKKKSAPSGHTGAIWTMAQLSETSSESLHSECFSQAILTCAVALVRRAWASPRMHGCMLQGK